MTIKNSILLMLLITSAVSYSCDDYIVKQGSVCVTLDDLDGFSYTIPKKDRVGFFSSFKRLNDTLTNLLNIKHIVRYARTNKLLNDNDIEENVNRKVLGEQLSQPASEFSIVEDNKFVLKKNYYRLEESYKQFQTQMKKSIDVSKLEELAKEKYLINKDEYKILESRDFDYISLKFNEDNFLERNRLAKEIQEKLKKSSFIEVSTTYKKKYPDLLVATGFKDFKFSNRYKEFSQHILSSDKIGVMDSVGKMDKKLIVVVINKITHENYKPYSEVKKNILNELIISKYKRDFQDLLSNLTKANVQINKEQVDAIQNRYK